MTESTPRQPSEMEPTLQSFNRFEMLTGRLAGVPESGSTKTARFLTKDSIVSVKVAKVIIAFGDDNEFTDESFITNVKIRGLTPQIDDAGTRYYPFRQFQVTKDGEVSVLTLLDSGESYSDSDTPAQRAKQKAFNNIAFDDENAEKGLERDLKSVIASLNSLSDEDKLDNFGRTRVEKETEARDIQAMEEEVQRLAALAEQKKFKNPIFKTLEGDTVKIEFPKAKHDNTYTLFDILPLARTTALKVLISKESIFGENGVQITVYKDYEVDNLPNRGMTLLSTQGQINFSKDKVTTSPYKPLIDIEERRVDETLIDPRRPNSVIVPPKERQSLLLLLKFLDEEQIKEK